MARHTLLAATIRITGAQLVCARCGLVMTNVTINALPMGCPVCEHTLITMERSCFNPDDQNEEPDVEDDDSTHPDRRRDRDRRQVLDGEFEDITHDGDCTCGDCMDTAYEVGR